MHQNFAVDLLSFDRGIERRCRDKLFFRTMLFFFDNRFLLVRNDFLDRLGMCLLNLVLLLHLAVIKRPCGTAMVAEQNMCKNRIYK